MQSSAVHHMFLLLITSISLCHAEQQAPKGKPRKPFAQGAPKNEQTKEGPEGIRLTAHSDPFPSKVSPEMVECILRQHPKIEHLIQLLKAKEKNLPPQAQSAIPTEMLLVGEPGVGKTTIAAAIALTLKHKVAFFHASSLAGNQFQNSGIKCIDEKLRHMIKEAEQSKEPYVIIIDELANLTSRYENEHNKESQAAISHLWSTFDAFRDSGHFLVIATANELKDIPSTIRSRFERNHFKIEKPNEEYRKEILKITLQDCSNITEDELSSLAKKLNGMSNRQIIERINEAKAKALMSGAEHFLVTKKHIEDAHDELNNRNKQPIKERMEETYKKNQTFVSMVRDAVAIGVCTVGIIVGVATIIGKANSKSSDPEKK